ncbi:MAG TPA: hypothetical protein VFT91_07625 [Dehalococcoidia bacterium]|nr:hypothetical protein [Dehalococcoidia bacterium]
MDAPHRVEEIREQLLREWPDLYVEVEGKDPPILKVYGARKLYEEQLAKAEALIGANHEIDLQLVECVCCSISLPVKTREIGEPVGYAARFIEEDGRGVAIMCNNEDGHTAHDWGGYKPLPK